jgi:hypothetical protein
VQEPQWAPGKFQEEWGCKEMMSKNTLHSPESKKKKKITFTIGQKNFHACL